MPKSPKKLFLEWDSEIDGKAPAPISETTIREYEKKWNISIPASYINFLKKQNGGRPNIMRFRVPRHGEWVIDEFYYLAKPKRKTTESAWDYGNIVAETEMIKNFTVEPIVAIGGDPFGNKIVLAYTSKSPIVAVTDHEADNKLYFVSRSFSNFIEMIY